MPMQKIKLRNPRKRRRNLVVVSSTPFGGLNSGTDFGSDTARDVIAHSDGTEKITAGEREIDWLAFYRAKTVDQLIVLQKRRRANGTPQARGPPPKD